MAIGKEKDRIHDCMYHDVAVQANRVTAQEPYNQEDEHDQREIEPGLGPELKDNPEREILNLLGGSRS